MMSTTIIGQSKYQDVLIIEAGFKHKSDDDDNVYAVVILNKENDHIGKKLIAELENKKNFTVDIPTNEIILQQP